MADGIQKQKPTLGIRNLRLRCNTDSTVFKIKVMFKIIYGICICTFIQLYFIYSMQSTVEAVKKERGQFVQSHLSAVSPK